MFGRKKEKKSKADDVVITTAKTIGTAVGTVTGATEIAKRSAADASVNVNEKSAEAVKKVAATQKQVAKQADEVKKQASKKVKETQKAAAVKAEQVKKSAAKKVDEVKSAADKMTPKKKKSGLLGRLRG